MARMKDSFLYDYNVAILKKYGKDYKLIRMNSVRKKGIEVKSDKEKAKRGTVNKNKLENNITRAKQKINEYALCNEWTWFCTLTLDKNKYDRYDLKKYIKNLGEFLHNQNRERENKIKYLIIPEQHKNGAWHLHALFMGLTKEELKQYTKDDFTNGLIPNYIRKRMEENKPLYKWEKYSDRFGYCLFDEIRDKNKISSYIVKYINKDMASSVTTLNSKLYYCSQGLEKAKEIKRGRCLVDLTPDYENEYCKINWLDWLDTPEEAVLMIEDNREMLRNAKRLTFALDEIFWRRYREIGFKPLSPKIEKVIHNFGWT